MQYMVIFYLLKTLTRGYIPHSLSQESTVTSMAGDLGLGDEDLQPKMNQLPFVDMEHIYIYIWEIDANEPKDMGKSM